MHFGMSVQKKKELVFQRNTVVVLYTYSDMSSGIVQSAVEHGHNFILTSHQAFICCGFLRHYFFLKVLGRYIHTIWSCILSSGFRGRLFASTSFFTTIGIGTGSTCSSIFLTDIDILLWDYGGLRTNLITRIYDSMEEII